MISDENREKNADRRNCPIGVFDSGIGGMTVLKEIWKVLPNESTIYFGDSGRSPYGTKSHDTIVQFSLQNMRFLLSQDVKLIVIACNTASAQAYDAVRTEADVPVVEVITPGAGQAVEATKNGRIGIIATRSTVSSGVYRRAVQNAADDLRSKSGNTQALDDLYIEEVACPLFVSLAEEGWWDSPATRMIAEEYLAGLKERGVDLLILGCTHYPLLRKVIGDVMGPSTILVDAGTSVANRIAAVLTEAQLDRTESAAPTHRFYTSDNPGMFEELAATFLGGGRPSGTEYVVTESFGGAEK